MSFNNVNQYTPNHKVWDEQGVFIPDIEHSEGERTAVEYKVAGWLPVQFYDKYYNDWYVVMPGKAVALDPDGAVMPAEYGLTSASVVYTSDDVTAGTIDIATGLPVSAAKTVTLSQLTGVRQSGWTVANAGVTHTSGFMGRFGVAFGDSTKKYPIGIAPYPFLQWCGGDGWNPTQYTKHNYNRQHQVTVLHDYAIRLPLIPAQVAAETVDKTATGSALVFGTRAVHSRANTIGNATGRYNSTTGTVPILTTYPLIALALDEQNLAKNTQRTQYVLSSDNTGDNVSTILVNEVSAPSAIRQAGDFFIDYSVGVIMIYSADGATLPTALSGASGTVSLKYYRYGAAPSTLSKFGCVLAGGLVGGDFLKVGTGSNLVIATPASDTFADILGQVVGFETYPRDYLDRVRTAYNPPLATNASGAMANGAASGAVTGAGQLDQLSGSATGGVPDLVHFAGGANQVVIINLVSR